MSEEMPEIDQNPSDKDIQTAVSVLKKLNPGLLPREIFYEFARLGVMPIVEVVPLRKNNEITQVLLLRRDEDDPNWPDKLHTPGTVLRSTDAEDGINGALQRIYNDELGFTPEHQPEYVGPVLHKVARGTELANVYSVDLTHEQIVHGEWHDIDKLPDSIVETQIDFILESAHQFNKGVNQ